ncbi:hypothetical protein QEN19_000597 [Hanseniaspora menglaensis]
MENLNKNSLFSSHTDKESQKKQMYKQKRKSQVFIAAQSLNDELINLKSLKRMSIGSIDDLDTRDTIFGQYYKVNKLDLETIDQEAESSQDDERDLRQMNRLTIDSGQYPDFYDTYNDENASSDEAEEYSDEGSELQNNMTSTNLIENSYNVTSAEYLDENNKTEDLNLNENEHSINLFGEGNDSIEVLDDDGDEDKEFTSSLLWVPANKHPSIKPEKYLKYVQGKLETLSISAENGYKKSITRSRSSNIEEALLKRRKSHLGNDISAINYGSRSKSLTRRPSKLRRSYIDEQDDTSEQDIKIISKIENKSRFSLKEITEELSKMSQNAGFSGNDAVSLARSLSMSIKNQKASYEDDLDFENDNYFESEFYNTTTESDEASAPSSPTSPISPNPYILKANGMSMFGEELERKKRKGKYQPSYELEIQSDSVEKDFSEVDSTDNDDDDYVIGMERGKRQDSGAKVTRAKTIKQIVQQQKKEIEEQVTKDRKISGDSHNNILSEEADDENDFASAFDKQELKTSKKSTLQRSKFNTYREKSFKNKIQHLHTLKNSKSLDGLTINNQNLMHKSNTPSPTSDSSVFDIRQSSHDTISSSDTGSMHTAEDSLISANDTTGINTRQSGGNESTASVHSSDILNLGDKSSKTEFSNYRKSDEKLIADNILKDDKYDDGKKKNKFYNILKKSKFKFNKTKESELENGTKPLTINTNLDSINSNSFGNINMSPESNAITNSSPSSPIKLPTFSSKRTLSGSKSKSLQSTEHVALEPNQIYSPNSPDSDDPLFELNQQLLFADVKKTLNVKTSVEEFKLNTIEDSDSILSPLSPSDMNMFAEDFDMIDSDAKHLDSDMMDSTQEEQIKNNDRCFSSQNNSLKTKISYTREKKLKINLFAAEKDGKHTSGKKLFNKSTNQNGSSPNLYLTSPITPPASPTKKDYADDSLILLQDDSGNLPPRKLTFKDVYRPQVPNSPMKYRDSSFGFPLPPLSISTIIMFDHRLPVSMERAIYRLSHMKLSENKRELRQQVLLSNFMYSYLNLVNHSLFLQKLEEDGTL